MSHAPPTGGSAATNTPYALLKAHERTVPTAIFPTAQPLGRALMCDSAIMHTSKTVARAIFELRCSLQ